MSFDQSVYNPGAVITLTVDYTTDDSTGGGNIVSEVTAVVSDSENSASSTGSFTVDSGPATPLPITVTASDNRPSPGTWTLTSNDVTGSGPWTGVAVLTSEA
jgi:hypothetical protein